MTHDERLAECQRELSALWHAAPWLCLPISRLQRMIGELRAEIAREDALRARGVTVLHRGGVRR